MKKDLLIALAVSIGVQLDPNATVQEIKSNPEFVDALIKKVQEDEKTILDKTEALRVSEGLKAETVEQLKTEKEKSKTLEGETELLKGEVASLEQAVKPLEEEVLSLHESAASQAKVSLGAKTVKIGGKNYQINTPKFKHKGKEYTADDLCENKDLQNELLEYKSGVIVELKSE